MNEAHLLFFKVHLKKNPRHSQMVDAFLRHGKDAENLHIFYQKYITSRIATTKTTTTATLIITATRAIAQEQRH